jgi:hypothetical protein
MNIVTLDFEIHHKGDTDKRIAAATAHLQEHEACIKPLEAELAKPAHYLLSGTKKGQTNEHSHTNRADL